MHSETISGTVGWLYRAQAGWDQDPPYQRPGGQWRLRQKQRLIDSLLNRLPVPPIYLHRYRGGAAVIDGKQRLETLREFIDGRFTLAADFRLLDGPDRVGSAPRGGEGYDAFTPDWRSELLGYAIPVVEISFARDEEAEPLVREIFLRLNAGTKVPRAHLARVAAA